MRIAVQPRDTGNVINPMDALRKRLTEADKGSSSSPAKAKGGGKKKLASGQREMFMAISGKGEVKEKASAKETKRPSRQRKAS